MTALPEVQPLTTQEQQHLTQMEGTIRNGWHGFVTVGEALLTIRDQRLYRAAHRTFGDYCEQVWGWSRQRAQQLMDAAQTSQALSTIGLQPENERQARELKAKTEAKQKARAAKDRQGVDQIKALNTQIDGIKNQMQFFLTKPGDFNTGKYSDEQIAKMFITYPEAGVSKEDKQLMDRYLQIVKQMNCENFFHTSLAIPSNPTCI